MAVLYQVCQRFVAGLSGCMTSFCMHCPEVFKLGLDEQVGTFSFRLAVSHALRVAPPWS